MTWIPFHSNNTFNYQTNQAAVAYGNLWPDLTRVVFTTSKCTVFLTILVMRSLASFWISPNANSNHTSLLIRDYSRGHYKVWDEFIHPFSNLYKSFHPTFHRVCDQLLMMGLKLIHVSEGTPVHRIIMSPASASTRYTIPGRHGPSRWLASPFAQAQIKHPSSASLAFAKGIHRLPVDFP